MPDTLLFHPEGDAVCGCWGRAPSCAVGSLHVGAVSVSTLVVLREGARLGGPAARPGGEGHALLVFPNRTFAFLIQNNMTWCSAFLAPGAELLSPSEASSAGRGGDALPTVQAHPLERPQGALIPNCWRAAE